MLEVIWIVKPEIEEAAECGKQNKVKTLDVPGMLILIWEKSFIGIGNNLFLESINIELAVVHGARSGTGNWGLSSSSGIDFVLSKGWSFASKWWIFIQTLLKISFKN